MSQVSASKGIRFGPENSEICTRFVRIRARRTASLTTTLAVRLVGFCRLTLP